MNQATYVQTVELHHKMWDICSLAPHIRLTGHQRIYGGIWWDQFVRLATETLTDLKTDLVVANNNTTYTKSTPKHTYHHYAPSVTFIHTTNHLFNCTHLRTTLSPLELWTDPGRVMKLLARWMEKLAGGPKAGWSDSPPPTNKGQGSG